jgi:hypothetical protein
VRRVRWLLPLVALCACRNGKPDEIDASLEVPASFDLGKCPVGLVATRPLTATDASAVPLTLALAATSPFSVDANAMASSGSAVQIAVRFTPASVGPFDGSLTIMSEAGMKTVALHGEGVAPCNASAACKQSTFDFGAQACVESATGDGTSCASSCVSSGTCREGACVGVAPRCDDGDPCTEDGCDQTGACIHVPRLCEVTDPCNVASCNSATGGCDETPVQDGTLCGETTCSTAHVCLNGTCEERTRPNVDVENACRYQSVMGAGFSTCGVTRGGGLNCWGGNLVGQLGRGFPSTFEFLAPFDGITSGLKSAAMAAGSTFANTCAALMDGGGECTDPSHVPFEPGDFDRLFAGMGSTCGLKGGALWCTVWNLPSVEVFDAGVVTVALGDFHGCAALQDGSVWCWGDNNGYALGYVGPDSDAPVQVAGVSDAIDVAAGTNSSCALTRAGQALCWGDQIAAWSTASPVVVADAGVSQILLSTGAIPVCFRTGGGGHCLNAYLSDGGTTLPWTDSVQMALGYDHLCSLSDAGIISCIGQNSNAQLDDHSIRPERPVKMPQATGASLVRPSSSATLVVGATGMHVIGDAYWLPQGPYDSLVDTSTPVDAELLFNLGAVAAFADGSLKTWQHVETSHGRAWTVLAQSGVPAHARAVCGTYLEGETKACSLHDDGLLSWWNIWNATGQTPSVMLPANTVRVRTSESHGCSLDDDGGIRCWGRNESGQLGVISSGGQSLGPTPPSLGTPAADIAVSGDATCAALRPVGISCWGRVPGGSVEYTPVTLPAEGALGRSLALGALHVCVLYGANGVVCRGANDFGQLGRYGPLSASWVNVAFDEPVVSLTSGQFANHTCARLATGEYECWGDNSAGQLGVLPLLFSDLPVTIDP